MASARVAAPIFLSAAWLVCLSNMATAGSWKFEFDSRDHPSLTYSEEGKTVFLLGCGHAFALQVKYPGTPKPSGGASIELSNASTRMSLRGEFEEPSGDDQTTFVQWDLGFTRQDPDLYGKRWDRARSRLLDLIANADPLTIASGRRRYSIPRVDVSGWRRPIERCGRD
jgi:hypothetical protein